MWIDILFFVSYNFACVVNTITTNLNLSSEVITPLYTLLYVTIGFAFYRQSGRMLNLSACVTLFLNLLEVGRHKSAVGIL